MNTARELTARLATLLSREQNAMADFLLALADFDGRRLWAELGHATLFSFLRRELGLSAGAAQYRKTAAELVRRYPEVEEALRGGRLCLSSVIELAKVLTPENRAEVLPRFFGLSSRDAAAVSASIRPVESPPLRDVVTSLVQTGRIKAGSRVVEGPAVASAEAAPIDRPPASPTPDEAAALLPFRAPEMTGAPSVAPLPSCTSAGSAPTPAPAPPSKAMTVEPLDAGRARLHVTVSRRFLGKLAAARNALSHARPGASAEEILEAGLDLVLAQQAKRKGIVEKPRKASPSAKAGHVPAHVKRAVWTRDGGRCQFPLVSGGVCGSATRVEFDHVVPRARGGPATVDNIRLVCRAHNDLAARDAFGDVWMDRFTHRGGAPAPAAAIPPLQPR